MRLKQTSGLAVLVCSIAIGGAVLSLTAQAPPGIPGLVSWWPGSNTKDVSGPNDGFLINGATIGKGRIGRGFSFDGVNDYFLVPFHPSLNVGAQGSIVFWMRADPSNPMNYVQGLVTTDYFLVEISPFGPTAGVTFIVKTPSGFAHTSDTNGGGAVVTAGEWHHIVGTYDGAQLQLYVDGLAWGNPSFRSGSIKPMESGSFLAIGSEDGRTSEPLLEPRYFHGQIDEVAIYNRALTSNEVHNLFKRGGHQ